MSATQFSVGGGSLFAREPSESDDTQSSADALPRRWLHPSGQDARTGEPNEEIAVAICCPARVPLGGAVGNRFLGIRPRPIDWRPWPQLDGLFVNARKVSTLSVGRVFTDPQRMAGRMWPDPQRMAVASQRTPPANRTRTRGPIRWHCPTIALSPHVSVCRVRIARIHFPFCCLSVGPRASRSSVPFALHLFASHTQLSLAV